MKNQFCQPEAFARKLNAAPVLCSLTRSKKGMTATRSKSSNFAVISRFVYWSTTITATDSRSQFRLGLFLIRSAGSPRPRQDW